MKPKMFCVIFIMISYSIHTQIPNEINIDTINYEYIDEYLIIELIINNRSQETIYVLKNYYIDNIVEEDEYLKLSIKSNWLSSCIGFNDEGKVEWIGSSWYHGPMMVEIRNGQIVYLTLILNITDKINITKKINEIAGIKYSKQEHFFVIDIKLPSGSCAID